MVEKRRMHRVSERIQSVIATELLRMSDPRFSLVTITSVVVSNDIRHAKVYFMVSGGPERIRDVQNAFTSATGIFRSAVGKELTVRVVPELRFYYDDTFDAQSRMDSLFYRIQNDRKSSEAEGESMEDQTLPLPPEDSDTRKPS